VPENIANRQTPIIFNTLTLLESLALLGDVGIEKFLAIPAPRRGGATQSSGRDYRSPIFGVLLKRIRDLCHIATNYGVPQTALEPDT
jgi:hypothetical protein